MDIEWIILADAAEVVNGKLYLLGGGWENLHVGSPFPVNQPVAIAASFRVPWSETNQRRNVDVTISDEDGQTLATINGQIEVGRPTGIPIGQAQRVQLAVTVPLRIEHEGTYVVAASVEGEQLERTTFHVQSRQPPLRR